MGADMSTQPFPDRVRALAAERGLSVSRVGQRAGARELKGTSPDMFKSAMAGHRKVTPVLLEEVARVLEVPPDEFPEYRLAVARRQLDENEVGLDEAVAQLEAIETAMRATLRDAAPHADEQPASSPRRTPADRSGPRNREAG